MAPQIFKSSQLVRGIMPLERTKRPAPTDESSNRPDAFSGKRKAGKQTSHFEKFGLSDFPSSARPHQPKGFTSTIPGATKSERQTFTLQTLSTMAGVLVGELETIAASENLPSERLSVSDTSWGSQEQGVDDARPSDSSPNQQSHNGETRPSKPGSKLDVNV